MAWPDADGIRAKAGVAVGHGRVVGQGQPGPALSNAQRPGPWAVDRAGPVPREVEGHIEPATEVKSMDERDV